MERMRLHGEQSKVRKIIRKGGLETKDSRYIGQSKRAKKTFMQSGTFIMTGC
jgi:hypothetical protein